MAEECAESCSVATSSSSAVVPPSNWWDLQGPTASALSSWCNNNTSTNNNNNNNSNNIPWQHLGMPNPNSNNSDEDVSISTSFTTNTSNHSGLSVESSRRLVEPAASSTDDLIGPPDQPTSDSHIWSQVFLNAGSNGDLQSHQDVGENFLDMLSSSKSLLFESDYLKKLDGTSNPSTWDHHHHQFPNSLNNHNLVLNNNNNHNLHCTAMNAEAAETKLSNLISTWSIAPPESAAERQISLRSDSSNHVHVDHDHHRRFLMKQALLGSDDPSGLFEASGLPRRPCNRSSNNIGLPYHIHHQVNGMSSNNVNIVDNTIHGNNYHSNNNYEMINSVDSYNSNSSGDGSAKNYVDVISFSGRLGKPLIDTHGHNNIKPNCGAKSLSLSDSKKQGHQTSSPPTTRSGGRANSTSSSESNKKRSEDTNNSETNLKKPKQESSTASSTKIQAPKVKLGDKITALQQIVSPFGKTDTASVLYEAIQYIKFLEEQVQLLSNPYMKTNSHKYVLQDPWGSLERKIDHLKVDHHHQHYHHHHNHMKVDLKSRGLCLVPVSCTPQVYRENTGSDYWTPTYRGCLYR